VVLPAFFPQQRITLYCPARDRVVTTSRMFISFSLNV
jgi:hypothetical protein